MRTGNGTKRKICASSFCALPDISGKVGRLVGRFSLFFPHCSPRMFFFPLPCLSAQRYFDRCKAAGVSVLVCYEKHGGQAQGGTTRDEYSPFAPQEYVTKIERRNAKKETNAPSAET